MRVSDQPLDRILPRFRSGSPLYNHDGESLSIHPPPSRSGYRPPDRLPTSCKAFELCAVISDRNQPAGSGLTKLHIIIDST